MARLRSIAAAALLAPLAAVAPAAPVPTHLMPKDPLLTYPAKVGTRWLYQEGQAEVALTVTEVELGERRTTVRVGRLLGGKVVPEETVEVTPAGGFRTYTGGRKLDRPICLLKTRPQPGDRWENNYDIGLRTEHKGTRTARGWEDVRTPAGAFRAARVEAEYTWLGKTRRVTFWYAGGVGEVRTSDPDGVRRGLKEFAPAGTDPRPTSPGSRCCWPPGARVDHKPTGRRQRDPPSDLADRGRPGR